MVNLVAYGLAHHYMNEVETEVHSLHYRDAVKEAERICHHTRTWSQLPLEVLRSYLNRDQSRSRGLKYCVTTISQGKGLLTAIREQAEKIHKACLVEEPAFRGLTLRTRGKAATLEADVMDLTQGLPEACDHLQKLTSKQQKAIRDIIRDFSKLERLANMTEMDATNKLTHLRGMADPKIKMKRMEEVNQQIQEMALMRIPLGDSLRVFEKKDSWWS